MAVAIDVVYQGDLHCKATHGPSQHFLITDAPTDNGGRGDAFSPTDLVATAMGTCLVTIMALLAERSGWDIEGTRVHVEKVMVADPVRRIGRLDVVIAVPQEKALALDEVAREKLERAALACPVTASLHPDVVKNIVFTYS
ncbi:MAG: OsmC family protein [Armatimonadetes bacterium]|nr:OsmC family protein [Armatimonadota bacterium]